jgi:GTP-binding protein Era
MAAYKDALNVTDIVPVSATKSLGLSELFSVLNTHAQPKDFLFSEDLFTDATEKEIVAELIREKAMLELKDELPYRVAVTIELFDESRREDTKKPLVTIDAVIHVERPTQKGIVIGKGGALLKAIGSRARKDLEHLLQCQVMLKLFVRVEPNWTTSAKSLKKLGF